MLRILLLNEVKVNISIVDIRLRSNLTTNKTNKFTKNSVFHTILGFVQSLSGPICDIEGFVQLKPGKHNAKKPIKFAGIDDIQLIIKQYKSNFVTHEEVPGNYSTKTFQKLFTL